MLDSYKKDPANTRTRLYFETLEKVVEKYRSFKTNRQIAKRYITYFSIELGVIMEKGKLILFITFIFIILAVLSGPMYILEEGTQSIVVRFGKVNVAETEAGFEI